MLKFDLSGVLSPEEGVTYSYIKAELKQCLAKYEQNGKLWNFDRFPRLKIGFWCVKDEIGLKEWSLSLRSAHKLSQELLGSMAKKAGKIYGTERDISAASATNKAAIISGTVSGNAFAKSTNGSNQRLLLRSRSCFIETSRLKDASAKLKCKDT